MRIFPLSSEIGFALTAAVSLFFSGAAVASTAAGERDAGLVLTLIALVLSAMMGVFWRRSELKLHVRV